MSGDRDVRLRAAGPGDAQAVTALLTEVFATDPLMRVVAGAAPDPRAALDALHGAEVGGHYLADDPGARAGARVDLAVDADGRLLGAALWDAPAAVGASPAGPLGPPGAGSAGPAAPPAGVRPEVVAGAWELCLLDAVLCERWRPAVPHWYLYMLAVREAARGRGVGGRLLAHGLERADADGLPAHLESTTPGSRRLYERHGFEHVADLVAAPLPTYWAMTRPARTPPPA